MEKYTLKQMSYKEKERTISAIFKEYRNAKFYLEEPYHPYVPSHRMIIRESEVHYENGNYEANLINQLSKSNAYREYVAYIDKALMHLPNNLRVLIENDYIKMSASYWWDSYYSRSTYYRYKKEAMDVLLNLLIC